MILIHRVGMNFTGYEIANVEAMHREMDGLLEEGHILIVVNELSDLDQFGGSVRIDSESIEMVG